MLPVWHKIGKVVAPVSHPNHLLDHLLYFMYHLRISVPLDQSAIS